MVEGLAENAMAGAVGYAAFPGCETPSYADLLEELRAVEREDPEGVRYPRFKTSDDATAVILRVL